VRRCSSGHDTFDDVDVLIDVPVELAQWIRRGRHGAGQVRFSGEFLSFRWKEIERIGDFS
jgi:hypothetical protein